MCWIIIYLLEIFLIKNLFNLLGKILFLKIINNYELWSETLIILLLGRTSLVRRWDRCVNEERTKGTGTWDRSTDPNEIRSPLGKSWERWRGAHEMVTCVPSLITCGNPLLCLGVCWSDLKNAKMGEDGNYKRRVLLCACCYWTDPNMLSKTAPS